MSQLRDPTSIRGAGRSTRSLREESRRRAFRRQVGVVTALIIAATVMVALVAAYLGREVVSSPTRLPATSTATFGGKPEQRTIADVAMGDGLPADAAMSLELPISLRNVTGIGFGTMSDPAVLALQPRGRRANVTAIERLAQRFLSTGDDARIRYYMIDDGRDARIVYVGARVHTEVYAPMNGTVTSVSQDVVDDEARGYVLEIQPPGDPGTVVVVTGLDVAPQVAVGRRVSAGTTLLGEVHPNDGARDMPLSRFTHDDGDGVALFVRRNRSDTILP